MGCIFLPNELGIKPVPKSDFLWRVVAFRRGVIAPAVTSQGGPLASLNVSFPRSQGGVRT